MSLHRETSGAGPDLALLHGWGLHGGIWQGVVEDHAPRFRVHALDLPGHGRSPWQKGVDDLEGLARRVAEHLPERCTVVGWSLGGQVALRIALRFPARVARLVLVATTPRFVAKRDWPHGMDAATFEDFAGRLAQDWRATVHDFLGLQVRGDERQMETLRELKRVVFAHGEPNRAALAATLGILRTADLRAEAARVSAPTLVISGQHDRLTPPAAAGELAHAIPGAHHLSIPRAGHAPFLSHRAAFRDALAEFLAS